MSFANGVIEHSLRSLVELYAHDLDFRAVQPLASDQSRYRTESQRQVAQILANFREATKAK